MKPESSLPLVTESSCGSTPDAVPVFNCIVIVGVEPETGRIAGRSANLPDIMVTGTSEREVLMAITRRFKAVIQQHLSENEAIPWKNPPDAPGPNESERFIPVHL